ncbi:unnamed protein product [Durusdinium trenchii]|uniref:Uncharacterized protein n=1 Tax=Durusdinium trenchii TaxID=1381693 RepID=A0ABP0MJC3_9DINO
MFVQESAAPHAIHTMAERQVLTNLAFCKATARIRKDLPSHQVGAYTKKEFAWLLEGLPAIGVLHLASHAARLVRVKAAYERATVRERATLLRQTQRTKKVRRAVLQSKLPRSLTDMVLSFMEFDAPAHQLGGLQRLHVMLDRGTVRQLYFSSPFVRSDAGMMAEEVRAIDSPRLAASYLRELQKEELP